VTRDIEPMAILYPSVVYYLPLEQYHNAICEKKENLRSHLAARFNVDSATFGLDPCRIASWLSNEPTFMENGWLVVENEPCILF
jgi:hypothetical protein